MPTKYQKVLDPKIVKRIDVAEALKMKLKGYDDPTIAMKFGISKQAVNQALSRFSKIIKHPDAVQGYKNNKAELLTAAELILLEDILDPEKRKKATQGNAAYAFDKVATHNRLEQGLSTENIAVQISDVERSALREIAQEVAKRAVVEELNKPE